MTTKELIESKKEDAVDVYALIPEILDLSQIEHLYNLNANTIRKERWLQKQIKEQKLTAKKLEKIDTSGFGFKYDPVPMYRKLYYRRKDVEHFIKQKMQQSPQELLLMAGIAERARSGRNISEQNNDIKKLYSENKVPPLTGFPLREGMENFDKPIERTDKSNTANIIDLIKSIRSDKDGNQYQVPLFKYPKGSKLVIYRGPYLDEIIDAFEANKDAGGTKTLRSLKKIYSIVIGTNLKLILETS